MGGAAAPVLMVAVGEEEDLERAVVEDAQEEVEVLTAAAMATAPGTASTTTTERTSMVHASTPISARIHQTLALVGNTSGDVEDVLEEMGLAVGTPDIAIHEAFKDSGYRSSLGPRSNTRRRSRHSNTCLKRQHSSLHHLSNL